MPLSVVVGWFAYHFVPDGSIVVHACDFLAELTGKPALLSSFGCSLAIMMSVIGLKCNRRSMSLKGKRPLR